MGGVQSKGFSDVLSCWSARKASLPAHYQLAIDYLGMPETSTPSERVNNAAGREFMCSWQFLSSLVFAKTMCVRSWMRAGIINVPVHRAAVVARASKDNNEDDMVAIFEQLDIEQEDWEE